MINWYKDKTKFNLIIDAIMLVLLMAIVGLGFLIKYILVPGFKRNTLYHNEVELYSMERTRRIHLWLSFIFLFLMLLLVNRVNKLAC